MSAADDDSSTTPIKEKSKSSKASSASTPGSSSSKSKAKSMDEFIADRDENDRRREDAERVAAADSATKGGPIRSFMRRQKMRMFYNDWSFKRVVQTLLGIPPPKRLRPKKSWKAADDLPHVEQQPAAEAVEEPAPEVKMVSKLSMRMKSMSRSKVVDTTDTAIDDDDDSPQVIREMVGSEKSPAAQPNTIPIKEDEEGGEGGDEDEEIELQHFAATVIQSLARMVVARVRRREQWEYAVEDGTDFWDDYSRHDKKFAYVRIRRAGIYVKNYFAKRYVDDILCTATLYVIQTAAAKVIQKVWRGFFIRSVVSLHRFPPRPKIVPRKRRFVHSDALYRRVWARRHFEPKKGWPVKMGYLEYDMTAYTDAPPAGHKYGPHTYKVILVPRSDEERSVLEGDEHSWVGLPIMVRTTTAHNEAIDPNRRSNIRQALRLKSQPLSQPVANLAPPPRPPRLKGDAALQQLGWVKPVKVTRAEKIAAEKFILAREQAASKSSDGSTKRSSKVAAAASSNSLGVAPKAAAPPLKKANLSKLPPPVYKLHIDDLADADATKLKPSSAIEPPSIYAEDYKERFAEYDHMVHAERVQLAASGVGKGILEQQPHIFDTSYLRALEKEIEEVERSRFGFKADDNQRVRYVTPLRGYKYLSSQHKKAFDYSRQYGAFSEPEKHTYESYLDKFGVNVGNKSISDLFFKKFAKELASTFGALGDANIVRFKKEREKRLNSLNPIKSVIANSNVEFDSVEPMDSSAELDSASWRTSSWASVKSGAEQMMQRDPSLVGRFDFGDEGLNSRSLYRIRPKIQGKVRIWAVKPKKHYKLRYTWVPQALVAKAAQMAHADASAAGESSSRADLGGSPSSDGYARSASKILLKNSPSIINSGNNNDDGLVANRSAVSDDSNIESDAGFVAVSSSGEDMRSFEVFLKEQKFRTLLEEPPPEMSVQEKIQLKLFPTEAVNSPPAAATVSRAVAGIANHAVEEGGEEEEDDDDDDEERHHSNIKRHMGSIVLMQKDKTKKKKRLAQEQLNAKVHSPHRAKGKR